MAETRFGALKELRRDQPTAPPDKTSKPTPAKEVGSPVRAAGKSRNRDFERLTVYVRKDSKKAATRKWEDATGQDMSDLVEHLLTRYLST